MTNNISPRRSRVVTASGARARGGPCARVTPAAARPRPRPQLFLKRSVPELLLFAFAAGARLSSLPGALPRPVVCAAVAQRGLDAWGQFTFKNRPGAEVHGATRCVTSCLVPGFGEELLFRGALQQKLCALLGTVPAVAACAVAFGAAHFLTPLYFLLSALGSLFFSACMTLRYHPRPRLL